LAGWVSAIIALRSSGALVLSACSGALIAIAALDLVRARALPDLPQPPVNR
jgi:hypothetical protein